jgi:uncharacterized protein involved in outer membrane biogenesis
MGCMKKALLVGGGLVAALLLLAFGYVAHLLGSLNTPAFKKSLLERAKASVGAEVQVKEMEISVLSGVTLKGVTVVNPAPFPGNLLTAEALVLRYRLWPLVSGQVEVERLALVKPVLTLAMDGRGAFNYERLASAGGASKGAPAPAAVALPIELLLKKLAVENARVVMQDQTKATLVKVDDVNLDSAFKVAAAGAQGSGKARVAVVNLADTMFLRDISAPIEMSKESLKLSPIRARLAGGDVTGDLTVNLKDGFRYTANLDVKGAHLKTLLEEAKSKPSVTGTLLARASFQGSGGIPTMKGKGRLEVTECKVHNAAVLGVVSAALRMPALANPDFDQCLVEFTMTGSRIHTPVVSLKGKQIQITGQGTTNLDTYALDYDMTLALAKEMLDKVGVRELRAAFKDRGDGFSAVDFKVTGTSNAPQTNLAAKVGAAAATEAAVSGLKRLFGKKKN